MKDNKIYAGQLKYYPQDFELSTKAEKDLYLYRPYFYKERNWKKLKADGILLNSRDIESIEFQFKKIENEVASNKDKKCKKCGSYISKNSKICAYCNTDQTKNEQRGHLLI